MSVIKGKPFPEGFSSGMFPAVLDENFILTASNLNRPFCAAKVDPFFKNMQAPSDGTYYYPLTLVPSWFFIYDLQAGDTIYVRFDDNDPNYPILCFVDKDLPAELFAKVSFPTSTLLSFPASEESINSLYIGPDFYILGTKTITVMQKGSLMQVWTGGKMYCVASDFGIKASQMEFDLGGQHIQITSNSSGQMVLNGAAVPSTTGFFNNIPVCPFTGLPHAGTNIIGL